MNKVDTSENEIEAEYESKKRKKYNLGRRVKGREWREVRKENLFMVHGSRARAGVERQSHLTRGCASAIMNRSRLL